MHSMNKIKFANAVNNQKLSTTIKTQRKNPVTPTQPYGFKICVRKMKDLLPNT